MTGKMIARNVDLRTQRTAKHTICTSVNRWTLLSGTWRRYGKSGWCFAGIMISLILSQNYKRPNVLLVTQWIIYSTSCHSQPKYSSI